MAHHPSYRRLLATLLAATAVLAVATEVSAAAGDLDPMFGQNGKRELDVFTYPVGTGVAVQPDGKIVVAVGQRSYDVFGVMRFLSDGRRDPSFGDNGRVRTNFDGTTTATDLLLQPDGKIVVAGTAGRRMVVARYLSGGTPDPTFGRDGVRAVRFPDARAYAAAEALTPDGSIVLAGYVKRQPAKSRFAVALVTKRGALDPSFSQDGRLVVSLASCACSGAQDVEVAADGTIFAAGWAKRQAAIVAMEGDGDLDPTFAGDGTVLTKFGQASSFTASALTLTTAGDLMLAGQRRPIGFAAGFLAAFGRDGVVDTSFNGDGVAWLTKVNLASALVIQADGKIVVAGGNCCGGGTELTFMLGRFRPDGFRIGPSATTGRRG